MMETLQDYLTAQYEDDLPPRKFFCPYCGKDETEGLPLNGTLLGGLFHPECERKAIQEGRLKYDAMYNNQPVGTPACVYSDWYNPYNIPLLTRDD